jgi:VCBS repeat-containing protein
VGNFQGNTLFYRNTGTATAPTFTLEATNPFGLTDVGYSAKPTFADIDNDGDLDAFVGKIDGNTLFYRNTGTASAPTFTQETNPFGLTNVGGYASPTFADIDNDGDLDAFVGNNDGNTLFFENAPTTTPVNNAPIKVIPNFITPVTNSFGLTNVGSSAKPTLVDIDNDGDLDAFVGNNDGNTLFYRNTGTAAASTFTLEATNPFGLTDVGGDAIPTFADIDNDGDLDAFVGNVDGNTVFYRNTGTAAAPTFTPEATNPFGLTDVGSYAAPTLADIDGDGDLDAFVGNQAGNTVFYRNTGTAAAPTFTLEATNPFGLTDIGFYAKPTFADIDGDGDLDAFVGEAYGNTLFYRNTGTVTAPSFTLEATNPFGLTDVGGVTTPTFADIDGDGDLDVFVGNGAGNVLFFENQRTATTPEDTAIIINAADLLADYSDVDGDTLSVTGLTADNGSLVDNGNGTYTFTPDANFNGTVTLTYGVTDGTDTLSGQTLRVYVTPVNDVPTGSPTAILSNTAEDTAIIINAADLLVGFSDVEGDTLSVFELTANNGALVDNGDGTYTFTPNANFNGTVTLSYGVTDVSNGTATLPGQTQTFSVTPVNDAPTDDTNFLAAQTNSFGLTNVAYFAKPTFADIDGDGDLDAFVGNVAGDTLFYRNTGTASAPTFTPEASNPFGLTNNVVGFAAPTFADIDGDGDLDAFVGNKSGDTLFYRNTGTAAAPTFTPEASNPFGLINVGFWASPTFADIDNDGDLDAFVGNKFGTLFFNNTGTATAPTFTLESDSFLASSSFVASPTLADIDGDGDLDAFVGSLYGDTVFSRNTGTADAPTFTPEALNPFGLINVAFFASPTFADIDNDGDLDAFVGNKFGDTVFSENISGVKATLSNTAEDTAIIITAADLLAAFSDVDGDTLSVVDLTADNGTLVDNGDGTYTFTPDADFNGTVILDYGVSDGTVTLAGQTQSFSVTPVNDAPVGSPTVTLPNTAEDTAINIAAADLLAGFSDVEGDNLSVVDLTADNGTLVDNGDGTYTFTPTANFNGTVTLDYGVSDGTDTLSGQTQTFSVTPVNDAPVGSPTATLGDTAEDTAITITAANLLAGFSDVEGDTLSVVGLTADNGALVDNGDGTYTFTPTADFNGAVTLSYGVSDGTVTLAGQTQSFSVTPVNDAPVGSPTATLGNTAEDTAIIINAADLLAGFSDVEGDTLSVAGLTADNGTLVDNGDGTYSFTPTANFNGTVTLDYGVSDGTDTLAGQTQTFSVTAVNDAPVGSPTATLGDTAEDTAIIINASDLLTGFSDVDGDTLSVVGLTADNGGLVDNGDGTYTFTPTADFNGTVTLDYGVTDGTDTLAGQTQSFSVTAVNDAPVGVNDSGIGFSTNEDTAFITANVLTNDTDVDNGDVLTITSFNTTGTLGLVTNNGNGTFSYNPNNQFESLNNGQTATDSFSYTVSDGKGGTSTASVSININGVTDVPVLTQISAESLTNVTGYRIENNPVAEGGSMLSLIGGPNNTEVGTATFTFNGPSGLYHLIIGTFDENDGQSTFNLTQQGNFVGSIVLNQDLNANLPSSTTKVERLLGGELTVTTGNSFTITGFENNGEAARLDFIRFVPVDAVTTAPGGNGSDNIIGGTGNDTVSGGNGNDNIYGGAGNDSIPGGNGNDTLYGGNGSDTLLGGNGNDVLYGDGFLTGGIGNDVLYGDNGNDTLYGGLGSDTLTGGNGQDVFAFTGGDGSDTITDFGNGDKIGLYSGLSFGQLSFSGSNIFVTSTNEMLATLTGVNTTTLTAANFVNL